MSDIDDKIRAMLNKSYAKAQGDQGGKYICWKFCQEIYGLFGLQLQHFFHQRELTKVAEPAVPCIVLFRAVMDWHSGVVWPDGLHFIHACSPDIFDPNPNEYIVCKDRLTAWPYKQLIEGYYAP